MKLLNISNLTQKPKFTLNSLNVRGLNNRVKRKTIFQWFKEQHSGITFLQETHSTDKDEKRWKAEWGNEIIFSHGTGSRCGVALLIDLKNEYHINDIKRDDDGRLVMIDITIDNEVYILINVYAPTKDDSKAQKEFFSKLEMKLNQHIGSNVIVGGDFNVCINPEIDKFGGTKEKLSASSKQITNISETYDLVDIWRVVNEGQKRFTWRSSTKRGRVASRLDFWLISSHLLFNVESTDIEPSIKTDHSLIKLTLFIPDAPIRGKGFWKFNSTLLTDKQYVNIIEEFCDSYEDTYNTIENKSLAWDLFKCKIRGITIQYSIQRSRKKKQYLKDLNTQLQMLEAQLDKNEDVGDMYNTVRKEIEQIQEETLRGNMVRSRAQWVEEGEKCSKFFMQLENRNYKAKCITLLKKHDKVIEGKEEILEECKTFYETLYGTAVTENDFSNCQFFNNGQYELNEREQSMCESIVTENECFESSMSFPNNKSPGCDGLTAEFYKYFWPKIKTYLMNSYKYSFKNNILSLDQRRALLVLIPKGNKDKRLLTNWRPISLLNMDYKILAKVLANRLQKVISKIIHSNQVGYIKGRYIGDNIRTMLDILDITKDQTDPGLMVMIDFEKAFDTISWKFLYETLLNFNFGPDFIKYIKLLYTSPQCSVMNNGNHTEFFNIKRGIRQGCPISALLFILCVETLAISIRGNKNIQGIKLKDRDIRITQYADDTCLYLNGTNSLENILPMFEDYYRYAGLRLNIEKTEIIWLGQNSRYGKIENIRITQSPVKILGIWVCKNQELLIKLNYDECVKKLKALLTLWSQRKLTIKGKITLLKSKALPLMMHKCSSLYVPKEIITSVERTLYDFVWNNKHHVKKCTLVQKIASGGLKMPDFAASVKANKLNFIKRIIDTESNCNKTAIYILKVSNIEQFLRYKNNTSYLHTLPPFYKQLLDIWYTFQNTEPILPCDIVNEILWFNERILLGNKPAYNKTWSNAGIQCIKDIISENRFMTKEQLNSKYNISSETLFYNGIKAAIPRKWLEKIFSCDNLSDEIKQNPETLCVQLDGKTVDVRHATCNQFYWCDIESNAQTPTSYYKWESYYYYANFDWENINKIAYECTSDTYLQSLQFKIIHRYFPCKYNLKMWSLENSNLCDHCNEIDSLSHYFAECEFLNNFWKYLRTWFRHNFEFCIKFTALDILLGIPNYDKNIEISILNFVILFAKYFIYTCKKYTVPVDFYQFLVKLKSRVMVEEFRCKLYNKIMEFETKWSKLLDIL